MMTGKPELPGRIMFIVNPAAGKRHGNRIARYLVRRNDTSFIPVILFTQKRGDAGKFVKMGLKDGIGKFVAVGGDGTVNEVASALIDTEGILGIIPAGSGNGLARHLKIPRRVSRALDILTDGRLYKMDYGLVDGKPFFCVSGVGFDAAVGNLFSEFPGRGLPVYAMAAITEYFRYKPKKYTIRIDGKRKIKRRAFLITFANASQYGNNAYIAPGADTGDGQIDLCILRPFHFIRSMEIVYGLFGKSLDRSSHLEIIKCSEVRLKRKNPGYIHYDGEPRKAGRKIRIVVVHQGLKVMVPGEVQRGSVI